MEKSGKTKVAGQSTLVKKIFLAVLERGHDLTGSDIYGIRIYNATTTFPL